MVLTTSLRRQLGEALEAAFPSVPELEKLVSYYLDPHLKTLPLGTEVAQIILAIIRTAESNGWLEVLIVQAHTCKSGNAQLAVFRQTWEQYKQSSAASVSVSASRVASISPPSATAAPSGHPFPEPWKFDLSMIEDQVAPRVVETPGLVGLVMPLTVDPFPEHFRERLKYVLQLEGLSVFTRGPFTVSPNRPAEQALKSIEGCFKLLATGEVMVTVPCHFDAARLEPVVHAFWQELVRRFPVDAAHRLIVILFTDAPVALPGGTASLERPIFRNTHAQRWFEEIERALGWDGEVRKGWKKLLIDRCGEEKAWNIYDVYLHLEETLELLKERPTPQAFLKELADRI